MTIKSYTHYSPLYYNYGPNGADRVNTTAITDSKVGYTTSKPYTTDTPYYRYKRSLRDGCVRKYVGGYTDTFTYWFGKPGYTIADDPNADLRLLGNLIKEIKGHEFNPGVSLGEANEVMGMMGSAAKTIAGLANSLPKVIPSSLWLQSVYGWMPLWGDLHAGAEFLASALSRPRRKTYRATTSIEVTPSSGSPYWTPNGKCSLMRYAVAHVEEDGTNLAFTGLIDPLSVAWELTPYSFVADWFIPIGDWLSARCNLASLNVTGCNGSVLRVFAKSTNLIHPSWEMILPAQLKIVEHSRTPGIPSLPPPRFTPLNRVLGNWRHLTDGFALAAQAFQGKKVRL